MMVTEESSLKMFMLTCLKSLLIFQKEQRLTLRDFVRKLNDIWSLKVGFNITKHHVNVGTIGHIDHGKTHLAKSIAGSYPQPSDWPGPERIENIVHNGGEALHYPKEEAE